MTLSHSKDVVESPERSSGLSFIEQLQKVASVPCSNQPNVWLVAVDKHSNSTYLMRPYCKCWKCPECAARNARRWIARIIHGVNNMDTENSWFMFTLTSHEKMRGETASVKCLRTGWKKLYNRIRYTYGASSYVKVWEKHGDGTFHLHGLIDCVIPERWLKDNARQCGMGYQVEIHSVENAGQVAGYIAKYFLKSEQARGVADFPRGLRRIECSRNWLKLPELCAESNLYWERFSDEDSAKRFCEFYQLTRGYGTIDISNRLDKV